MRFKTDKVINAADAKNVANQSLFSSQTAPVFGNPQNTKWPSFQIPLKKQWHRRQAFIDDFSTNTSSNVNPFLAALENTKKCLSESSPKNDKQINETFRKDNTFVLHPFSSGKVNALHSKPKGLVDGLSRFFTPSNKRKSRVAISSLGHAIEDEIQANQAAGNSLSGNLFCDPTSISKNHFNSNNIFFKSRCQEIVGLPQSSIEKHPSITPAINTPLPSNVLSHQEGKSSSSLKNLFDGLSHLYATPSESRKRRLKGEEPNYSLSKRQKKNVSSTNNKTVESKICDKIDTGDKQCVEKQKAETTSLELTKSVTKNATEVTEIEVPTKDPEEACSSVISSKGVDSKHENFSVCHLTFDNRDYYNLFNPSGTSESVSESEDANSNLFDAYFRNQSCKTDASGDVSSKNSLPNIVNEDDMVVFRKAQAIADERIGLVSKPSTGNPRPSLLQFGNYEISVLHSSPYPKDYLRLPKLFLCEFCLKYIKSKTTLKRHMNKCSLTRPPADEIYRKDDLSVFEVDGVTNKTYCQNLCLLGKLFLNHKTLFYDVESFLFYVLTENDKKGCHLIGYFSKERYCQQKYNVSCIMVLPQHRRKGYGHFLINLSYHLSKREGKYGTPEKPLSDEGRACYSSYWKSVILEHFQSCDLKKKITLKSISKATGMTMLDVISTLGSLNMLKRGESGKFSVLIDSSTMGEYYSQLAEWKSKRIELDSNCLVWEPQVILKADCKKCKKETSRLRDKKKQTLAGKAKTNNRFEKIYIGGTWYSKEKIKCETCLLSQEREKRKLKYKNKRRHLEKQTDGNCTIEPKRKKIKFNKFRNTSIDSSDDSDDYIKYTSAKIRSLRKKLLRKHKFRQMKFQERKQKQGVMKYSVAGEIKSSKVKVHGFLKESGKLTFEGKKKLKHKRLKKEKYKKMKKRGKPDSVNAELTKDKKKHKVKMKKNDSKSSSGEKESVPTPPVLLPAVCSDEDLSQEENSASDHNLSPPRLQALNVNSGISVVKSSESESSDESLDTNSNANVNFEVQNSPQPDLQSTAQGTSFGCVDANTSEAESKNNSSEKSNSEEVICFTDSNFAHEKDESGLRANVSDVVASQSSLEIDGTEADEEIIIPECNNVPSLESEIIAEKQNDVAETNAILEATELIVKEQLMQLPSVEEICIDDPVSISIEDEKSIVNDNDFKSKNDVSYEDDDGDIMMIHHTMPISCGSTVDMNCMSTRDELKNEEEENEVREAVETINVQMEHHSSSIDMPLTPLTPQSPESDHLHHHHHRVNSYDTEYDHNVSQATDDSNQLESQEVECLSNEMSENLQECRYPQKQYSTETHHESNSNSGPYSQDVLNQPEIIIDSSQISQPVSQVSQLSSPSTPGGTMVSKNTPTPQEMSSMGVYTPDSSTNSGYNSVEIDVCQLGLESPTSVCSSEMAQNSVEPPHSTPTPQPYPDCAQLSNVSPYCANASMSDMCSNSSRREMLAAAAAAQAAVAQAQAQAHHNSAGSSANVSSRKRQNNSSSQRMANLPPAGPVSSIMQSSMVSVNATAVNALFVGPAPNTNNAYVNAMNMSVPCSNSANAGGPVAGSYMVGVPLATVIQPQSTAAFAAASMQSHQASQNFSMTNHPSAAISGAMQRLTHVGVSPSITPSSCSVTPVTSNFHLQSPSYTYTPTPTPTPNTPSQIGTSCSLAKLQQLTNGIMDIVPNPACNTMTPPPNMTPPSPQVNMTPPPQIQRSLTSLQQQIPMQPSSHGYSKYHFHHRQVQRNPNVALSPNLVASYQTINGVGYRIQQAPSAAMLNTGYITNAGFINQAQLPPSAAVQMGMVNVNMHSQPPYQETLQTARPQNAMYTTYSYHISGNLQPQPLNPVMRR